MRKMLSIAFAAANDSSTGAQKQAKRDKELAKSLAAAGAVGLGANSPPYGQANAPLQTPEDGENHKPKAKRKRTRRRRNKAGKGLKVQPLVEDASMHQQPGGIPQQSAAPSSNHYANVHSPASNTNNCNNSNTNSSSISKKKQHDKPMTKRDLYFSLQVGMVAIAGGAHSVGRVTLVNWDGEIVLDKHVQVPVPVLDYQGIQAEALHKENGAVQFAAVRSKLGNLLRGKILIGHSLDVALMALGLTHPWSDVRDTAAYPRFAFVANMDPITGRPLVDSINKRPSLDVLVKTILKRDLAQVGVNDVASNGQTGTPAKTGRSRRSRRNRGKGSKKVSIELQLQQPQQQQEVGTAVGVHDSTSGDTEAASTDNASASANASASDATTGQSPIFECIASMDLYKAFRKEWEQDLVDHMAQQTTYYEDEDVVAPMKDHSSNGNSGGQATTPRRGNKQQHQHHSVVEAPYRHSQGYPRARTQSYDSCSSYDESVYSNPSASGATGGMPPSSASSSSSYANASQSWTWFQRKHHHSKAAAAAHDTISASSYANSYDDGSDASSFYGSHTGDSFHDRSTMYTHSITAAESMSLASMGSDSFGIPVPPDASTVPPPMVAQPATPTSSSSSSSWFPRLGGSKKNRHPMASLKEVDDEALGSMVPPHGNVRDMNNTGAFPTSGVDDTPAMPVPVPPIPSSLSSKGWFSFRRNSSSGKRRASLETATNQLQQQTLEGLELHLRKQESIADDASEHTGANDMMGQLVSGLDGSAHNAGDPTANSIQRSAHNYRDSVTKSPKKPSSSPAKWFGLRRSSSTGGPKNGSKHDAVARLTFDEEKVEESELDLHQPHNDQMEMRTPTKARNTDEEKDFEIEQEDESFDPSGHYGAKSRKLFRARSSASPTVLTPVTATAFPPLSGTTPSSAKSPKWFGFRRPKSPTNGQSGNGNGTPKMGSSSRVATASPDFAVPDNPWSLSPRENSDEPTAQQFDEMATTFSAEARPVEMSNLTHPGVAVIHPNATAVPQPVPINAASASANQQQQQSWFAFRKSGQRRLSMERKSAMKAPPGTEMMEPEAALASQRINDEAFNGLISGLPNDDALDQTTRSNSSNSAAGGKYFMEQQPASHVVSESDAMDSSQHKKSSHGDGSKSSSWFSFRRSSKRRGLGEKSSTDSLLGDNSNIEEAMANQKWVAQQQQMESASMAPTAQLTSGEFRSSASSRAGRASPIRKPSPNKQNEDCSSPTQSDADKTISTTTTGTDWFEEVVHGHARCDTTASSVDLELSRSSGLDAGVVPALENDLPIAAALHASGQGFAHRHVSRLAALSQDFEDGSSQGSSHSNRNSQGFPQSSSSTWLDDVVAKTDKGSITNCTLDATCLKPAWFEHAGAATDSSNVFQHDTAATPQGGTDTAMADVSRDLAFLQL